MIYIYDIIWLYRCLWLFNTFHVFLSQSPGLRTFLYNLLSHLGSWERYLEMLDFNRNFLKVSRSWQTYLILAIPIDIHILHLTDSHCYLGFYSAKWPYHQRVFGQSCLVTSAFWLPDSLRLRTSRIFGIFLPNVWQLAGMIAEKSARNFTMCKGARSFH